MEENERNRRIRACINGSLSEQEMDELWIEFLQHPDLFDQFQTELHLADLFTRKGYRIVAQENSRPSIMKLSSPSIWFYSAAAALLLVVGLQFFSQPHSDSFGDLALLSIDHEEMVGSVVFRNEDTAASADLAINQALSDALMGHANRSYQQFLTLSGRQDLTDPQQASILLNLGILEYNQMRYAEAAGHFRSVLGIENLSLGIREKAWWFLGNALLNIGNVDEARAAVFTAYGLDGKFQRPALALLKRMDEEMSRQNMQTDGQTLPDNSF